MEISPFLLMMMLIWSFVFGVILGVVNDANRIVRVFCGVRYVGKSFDGLYDIKLPIVKRPIKRNSGILFRGILSIIIFLQDILFFLVAGIGISIINYEFNDGRFRFFTVLMTLLGFLIYYFTVGKLVVAVSECIAFVIKAIFVILFGAFLKPIALLGHFFAKILKKVALFFDMSIANFEKRLYNNYKKKCIVGYSLYGFLNEDK